MKKCAYADKYRALRAPRCNGGKPCDVCRDKWSAAQAQERSNSDDDAWAEAFVAGAIIGDMF